MKLSHPKYLRRKAAAQYLRDHWGYPCTTNTLAKLAVVGGGPIFNRAGRMVFYAIEELDRYVEVKLGPPLRSTADIAAKPGPISPLRMRDTKCG